MISPQHILEFVSQCLVVLKDYRRKTARFFWGVQPNKKTSRMLAKALIVASCQSYPQRVVARLAGYSKRELSQITYAHIYIYIHILYSFGHVSKRDPENGGFPVGSL